MNLYNNSSEKNKRKTRGPVFFSKIFKQKTISGCSIDMYMNDRYFDLV